MPYESRVSPQTLTEPQEDQTQVSAWLCVRKEMEASQLASDTKNQELRWFKS